MSQKVRFNVEWLQVNIKINNSPIEKSEEQKFSNEKSNKQNLSNEKSNKQNLLNEKSNEQMSE
jgi:hypothetical protein